MSRLRIPLLTALAVLAVLLLAACGDDDDEDVTSDAFATTTIGATATVPGAQVTDPPATANGCPAPSGEAPEPDMNKQYSAPPEMTIDPGKSYDAVVHTVRGDFTIHLRPDLAPQHVNSFVFLANEGFYDGVTFHRVLPGFVAQAGDPTGTGSGGPGYSIPAEFTTAVQYARGTVGMARAPDPDSAGSQWFVTYAPAASLDGAYTIFGEVTEGMEVADCMTPRDPATNPNAPAGDAIISIDINES